MATKTTETTNKSNQGQAIKAWVNQTLANTGINTPNNEELGLGYHDYTEARKHIYKDKSAEQIHREIEEMKKPTA